MSKIGEKWGKVEKVVKSGEKWGKVVKSWNKWGNVGKNGEKWRKAAKSGEKLEKVWNSFRKMAADGHFLWPKNHFRLHFSPFLINTQFFFLIFFFIMAASGHFGFRFLPKSIGTSLYSMSVSTLNMKLIGTFLIKLYTLHTHKHPLCCGVGKIESLENNMFPCMVCLLQQ